MAKLSKKMVAAKAKVDDKKKYSLKDALALAKETSYTKFDGSIDLAIVLNLDVRQADQQLRGSISLPCATGKVVRILAATDKEEVAKNAGATIVASGNELTEILKKGKFDFDVIVTEPKHMPVFGKFGKELGPKGLMPNPKTGTVTPDVVKTITEILKGKANYRTDKNGVVHTSIGKVSMQVESLLQNAEALIETIKKVKPKAVKGTYIKAIWTSSSMGPSIKIAV